VFQVPLDWAQQYLGEEEVPKLGVLGDPASQTHGDYVSKSLDLVDHSLGVGHLGPVLKLGLPVLTNHLVNLFMDLGWGRRGMCLGLQGLQKRKTECRTRMPVEHSNILLRLCMLEQDPVDLAMPELYGSYKQGVLRDGLGEQAVCCLDKQFTNLPISSCTANILTAGETSLVPIS
jgi:hypothetical protein